MNKMMTWYGIQMNTMTDDSTSKLSELIMQGTNMGIIEGRRLLNQNCNIGPDVKNILNDFVVMQEDSIMLPFHVYSLLIYLFFYILIILMIDLSYLLLGLTRHMI